MLVEFRVLTVSAIIVRILLAVLIGSILGFERGMKNRPAGLRTYILVCVGATIVMLTNQYIYQCAGTGDPVRMGAQVVSGIGFLGAGTIIVTQHNQIKGLTTAAGLWASACVGLAIGIGLYEVAIIGGITIFGVLTCLHRWDYFMRRRARVIDVYVELDKSIPMGEFIRNLRDRDIDPSNLQVEKEFDLVHDINCFTVTLTSKKAFGREELVRTVTKMEGVKFIEEL